MPYQTASNPFFHERLVCFSSAAGSLKYKSACEVKPAQPCGRFDLFYVVGTAGLPAPSPFCKERMTSHNNCGKLLAYQRK